MRNPLTGAVRRAFGLWGRGSAAPKFDPNVDTIVKTVDLSRPMERKDEPAGPTIKALEGLKTEFLKNHGELKAAIDKANGEIANAGRASTETKAEVTALVEKLNTLGLRLDKAEAKANRDPAERDRQKSLGDQFIETDVFKSLQAAKRGRAAWQTKAIINATGQNQPLVPDQRVPGIQTLPNRRLRIRQLLNTGRTVSNLIQYAQENVYTNLAGPQAGGSPPTVAENQVKNESTITFQLLNAPVVTLAHFIRASKQILDDAPQLASYINGRLQYGLALEEERELLNGDGSNGTLNGLMNQATGFNALRNKATDTKLDYLRRAITQLQLSEYDPEFIVLNPTDWEDIELTKDTQGRYIIANPQGILGPQVWGLPVVATNTMSVNQFLVANGSMAAQLWDREDAGIIVSTEDSDNVQRNMVTILCEERLALTVYRPTALIKGNLVNP